MVRHNSIQTNALSKNSIDSENDVISLVDLYMVLVRRKIIIIVTTIISFLLALAYLLLQSPVYESTVVIQVGQFNGGNELEDLEFFKDRLRFQYSFIESIDNKKNFVVIKVRDNNAAMAEKKLKKVVDQTIEYHGEIYNNIVFVMQKKHDLMLRQIKYLRSELKEHENVFKEIPDVNLNLAGIIFSNRSVLINSLINLEKKLLNNGMALKKSASKPTKVIIEPVTENDIFKKRNIVISMLSIVAGLMIGMFNAFIYEVIIKVKQQVFLSGNEA